MVEPSGNRVCQVCNRSFAQNTCPKCRCQYCSLSCYKQHSSGCTEAFYRDQAVTELKGIRADDSDKRKVLEILQRFHDGMAKDADGMARLEDSIGEMDEGDEEDQEEEEEEEEREGEASSGDEDGLGSILSEQTVLAILRKVGAYRCPLHKEAHLLYAPPCQYAHVTSFSPCHLPKC